MRYMIFSHTVNNVKYLFAAEGLSDSEFLHQVLCLLDFEEYTVQFTSKMPRETKNRVWYCGVKVHF